MQLHYSATLTNLHVWPVKHMECNAYIIICCAEFISGNINTYLHLLSSLPLRWHRWQEQLPLEDKHEFIIHNQHNGFWLIWWRNIILRENHHASVVWNWYQFHMSCNRVFISAESVGRGWCKIAIATKWYQFHTTDKCGFLFMPWITDQYIFVRYTKLINEIGTAVAKVITFSIMTT